MSLLSPPLQAFVAVATRKTVQGAARELGLTQTGVTQRIRGLEKSLATDLFTRSRRGMLLTSEGEALLRYCHATRDLEGETLARMQKAGRSAPVRVTLTGPTSIMRSRVVPQCMPLLNRFSELLLQFRIIDDERWVDELRTGAVQLAVVPPPLVSRELESKLLRPERFVLLGPRAWKNRPLLDIIRSERIIDFSPDDRMAHQYLGKFRLLEHARPDRHFVNNTEALAEMVQAGLGYGVFTEEFASRFLDRCDVSLLNEGKAWEHLMALAWYPRPEGAAYWRALVASIR